MAAVRNQVDDGRDARASREGDRVYPQRFWLLDNLRGMASLSVVIFHYQHFYFSAPGTLPTSFDRSALPFYGFLCPLYNMGYNAVQLFFVISGFVFFFVYYRPVRDQTVTGREYFVARFSRLYPLHAATLIFVAFGQWISMRLTGQFTVYSYNDFYHFVLNCFFASHWGLQSGDSFNGPVWSLSIEVVLYFLFYIYASQIATNSPRHFVNLLIACGLLLAIRPAMPTPIAEILHAAVCFLAGGIAFFVWEKISRLENRHQLWLFAFICVGVAAALLLFIATELRAALHFVVFPALVLSLGVAQSLSFGAGKNSRIIGDISYSTYLLHFPLQLSVIITAAYLDASIDFNRVPVFLIFLVTLALLSIGIFYWFERPMQKYLRLKLLRKG